MRHLDLFSGIGGFALAARVVGWQTVGFCEIEAYCQKVLRKHWPDVPIYDDVRSLTGEQIGTADIITGGFPCQPYSLAGERRGDTDDRHLWPEYFRLVREIKPSVVVGENVVGIIGLALDEVLSDLARIGYTTETFVIPACAVDANHRRDRVWVVAYSKRFGVQGWPSIPAERLEQSREEQLAGFLLTGSEASVSSARDSGIAHGVSGRVDSVKRNRAIGNAIVPQVAEMIFRAIAETAPRGPR